MSIKFECAVLKYHVLGICSRGNSSLKKIKQWNELKLKKPNRVMKKGAGSNYLDMKNQPFIVQIAAAGCLADFLRIGLSQMET